MDHMPLVLCVDDDADFCEIIKTKLAAAGMQVDTAEQGEEGLMKAKAKIFGAPQMLVDQWLAAMMLFKQLI